MSVGGEIGRVVRQNIKREEGVLESATGRTVRATSADAVSGSIEGIETNMQDALGVSRSTSRATRSVENPQLALLPPARAKAVRTLEPSSIDFSQARSMVPSADLEKGTRFAVPIPKDEAAGPLVYPNHWPASMRTRDGAPDPRAGTPHPKAGMPIENWKGEPILNADGSTPRGHVLFNYEDGNYQGVQSTGDKVVLFNKTSPEQRRQLQEWIDARGGPTSLHGARFDEFMEFARRIGADDRYDSSLAYVASDLRVAPDTMTQGAYGTFMRSREAVDAVRIDGPATIGNTRLNRGESAVFVRTASGETRHVTPAAFEQTYANVDGTAARTDSLPSR